LLYHNEIFTASVPNLAVWGLNGISQAKHPLSSADKNFAIIYTLIFLKAGGMTISKNFFEQATASLVSLDKEELKRRIRKFHGRFRLDFTEEYLDSLSPDRLRHILLAAVVNARAHN